MLGKKEPKTRLFQAGNKCVGTICKSKQNKFVWDGGKGQLKRGKVKRKVCVQCLIIQKVHNTASRESIPFIHVDVIT